MSVLRTAFAMAALGFVAGCGNVHDEKLVGRYRLVAIDTNEQMMLCWSVPSSDGDCLGDELPGNTLFAAGYNTNYIVAATHPSRSGQPVNRAVTHYYFVTRSPTDEISYPWGRTTGPLTEAQFNAAKAQRGLPDFSRVFEDLR